MRCGTPCTGKGRLYAGRIVRWQWKVEEIGREREGVDRFLGTQGRNEYIQLGARAGGRLGRTSGGEVARSSGKKFGQKIDGWTVYLH